MDFSKSHFRGEGPHFSFPYHQSSTPIAIIATTRCNRRVTQSSTTKITLQSTRCFEKPDASDRTRSSVESSRFAFLYPHQEEKPFCSHLYSREQNLAYPSRQTDEITPVPFASLPHSCVSSLAPIRAGSDTLCSCRVTGERALHHGTRREQGLFRERTQDAGR